MEPYPGTQANSESQGLRIVGQLLHPPRLESLAVLAGILPELRRLAPVEAPVLTLASMTRPATATCEDPGREWRRPVRLPNRTSPPPAKSQIRALDLQNSKRRCVEITAKRTQRSHEKPQSVFYFKIEKPIKEFLHVIHIERDFA